MNSADGGCVLRWSAEHGGRQGTCVRPPGSPLLIYSPAQRWTEDRLIEPHETLTPCGRSLTASEGK